MSYKIIFRTPESLEVRHRISTHKFPNKGIAEFTDGFWVNHNYQLTYGEDCLIYVMPHHIEEIRRA